MQLNNSKWSMLRRLRKTVKKITFLLNYNVNKWKLASMMGASSSKRRLSFNKSFGLRVITMDDDDQIIHSSEQAGFRRSISSPISGDLDVDKRAEKFIANFYRQLQIERQISLELKYDRGHSFGSASPL